MIYGTTQDLMRTKVAREKAARVGMIRIARAGVALLREDLIHYGITAATVFPELGGLCQEICSKWRNR